METKLIVTNDGLFAKPQEQLVNDLIQTEILNRYQVNDHPSAKEGYGGHLKWKFILDAVEKGEYFEEFKDSPLIQKLQGAGLDITNLEKVNDVVKAKAKRYARHLQTIPDILKSESFERTKEQIRKMYGGKFKDGSQLFDYQIETAALIVHNRRLLNANDTGTGKTRTTLVGLTTDPRNKKIIIVTMSRNLFDWKREMAVLGLENDYIHIKSVHDMKSTKRIHLVSYETWANQTIRFKKDESGKRYTVKQKPVNCPECAAEWEKKKNVCKSCGYDIVEFIKKPLYRYFNRSYDACAIDEGHYIKNGDSARTQSIMAIKTKTRVVLTGTPAENTAKDLYWPLAWLIGDRLSFSGKSKTDRPYKVGLKGEGIFSRLYGGTDVTNLLDSKKVNKRASNVEELWGILDTIMHRKRKTDEDVANEIRVPEPIHRRLHLEMTDPERAVYDIRLKEFNEWYLNQYEQKRRANYLGKKFNISSIEVCAWLDKLRKVTSCPWLQPEYDTSTGVMPSKLAFTRDKLTELNYKKKKALIFTAHRQTAEQLGLLLDEYIPGVNAAFIHGGVDMEYREHLMARFQDPNDSLRVLVMTMRTGAESYTLTEAKEVILFDLDFNAKKIEQCYSRAVRLGQKEAVTITWLINVDTIDANMHALILSKKAGVDLAIDRVEMDFKKLATEFEGNVDHNAGIDFVAFAEEMLKRGVSREDYQGGTSA